MKPETAKRWVIINLPMLCVVPILFVLGLLWPLYWKLIFNYAMPLMPILIFHILYQGFYIGGFVALITVWILISQIRTYRRERQSIPALLIAGEILVILLGVLDVLPISARLIGKLYYMIPGW